MGWRLPAIPALESLVDATQQFALPAGHPFTVSSSTYWSVTTSASDPAQAWKIGFDTLHMADSDKADYGMAWCVRGGPGGNTQ